MADIKKLQEKHREYLISKGLNNPDALTWHNKRRAGLGGSDIGAILGVNPYKSAYDLYLDKVNPAGDNNGNLRTQFGHDFEHVIAEKFALNYPQFEVQVDPTHYIHPEYLWLNGNIDRKLINRDTKECGVLEIKTTRTFDPEDWGKGTVYGIGGKIVISDDKVPESYYYQVQHYLCVTGFKFAYLYAFALDTCEYRLYKIDRDETKIKLLIKIGTEFWFNNVIKGVEPEHTITPDKQISTATSIKATDDVFKLVQALKDVKIQIKALESVEDNLSAQIKEFMQQNEILNDSDGKKLLSYKTSYRRDFDKSAFESDNPDLYNEYLTDKPIRTLRLATKKEKNMNNLPTGRSLNYENFEKLMKFAEFLSKSKLIPVQFQGKPEDILVAIMWGTSLGLGEMQSLNAICVINGRPSLYGDAPKALCMKYGKVIEEWDAQNSMWIVTCKRDGYPDVVQTFGYNDAIAAGYVGYDQQTNTFSLGRRKSDAWLSNIKRMCQFRARGFALRDAFPDILNGINFEGDGYDEIPNPTAETVTEVTPDVQQITEQKNNELMQQLQATENVAEAIEVEV